MNRLRKDLTEGQIVVTNDGFHWKLTGGFGLSNSGIGSALYAKRVDGVKSDIRYEICREATPEETAEFEINEPHQTILRLQANVERRMADLEDARKELDEYRQAQQQK